MFYLGPEVSFAMGGDIATPSEISSIRAELDVTGEFARLPAFSLDTSQPFRKSKPTSEEDSVNGRICTASKIWFPAHRVIYVGGLPYGDTFAPREPI